MANNKKQKQHFFALLIIFLQREERFKQNFRFFYCNVSYGMIIHKNSCSRRKRSIFLKPKFCLHIFSVWNLGIQIWKENIWSTWKLLHVKIKEFRFNTLPSISFYYFLHKLLYLHEYFCYYSWYKTEHVLHEMNLKMYILICWNT